MTMSMLGDWPAAAGFGTPGAELSGSCSSGRHWCSCLLLHSAEAPLPVAGLAARDGLAVAGAGWYILPVRLRIAGVVNQPVLLRGDVSLLQAAAAAPCLPKGRCSCSPTCQAAVQLRALAARTMPSCCASLL